MLDNSDFRNPVNQRGQDNYRGTGYGIDRWRLWHASNYSGWMVSIEEGHIRVSDNPDSSSTAVNMLRQDLPLPAHLKGKTVTLAARVKGYGNVRANINNISDGISLYRNEDGWYTLIASCALPETAETFFVALQSRNPDAEGYLCEWIALYEGEYNEYTLPDYQPKGYATELLECQRYYVSFDEMTFRACLAELTEEQEEVYSLNIPFPVPMRVTPTIINATAREGQLSDPVNVSRNGISYSTLSGKYTLRYVSASADFL